MNSDQYNDRSIDAVLSTILAEVRELRRLREENKSEVMLAQARIETLERFRWIMVGACFASGASGPLLNLLLK